MLFGATVAMRDVGFDVCSTPGALGARQPRAGAEKGKLSPSDKQVCSWTPCPTNPSASIHDSFIDPPNPVDLPSMSLAFGQRLLRPELLTALPTAASLGISKPC